MENPSYLAGKIEEGQRQSLEPLKRALQALQNPQLRYPTVLVGGTNGKGSTTTLLAGILRAAGYRTGCFVSPARFDFHDMIALDAVPLSAAEGRMVAERIWLQAPSDRLTAFEMAAAMAFVHFETRQADIAVVEVGMGGLWDATNLCEPSVAIITQVARDHLEELGPTLEHIAEHKAGIARQGRCVVTAERGKAWRVLEASCLRRGARVLQLGRDFHLTVCRDSLTFARGSWALQDLIVPLAGVHQGENAALAIAAALCLADEGWSIPPRAIREGLAGAFLAGRLQTLRSPEGRYILLDGAHNPHAAQALARYLSDAMAGTGVSVVLAMYRDKEVEEFVQVLAPVVSQWTCTSTLQPRSLGPEVLAQRLKDALPGASVCAAASVGEALERARIGTEPVLVTGSLALIAPTVQTVLRWSE